MDEARISVDLNSLQPVACTAALASLLGYASTNSCLRQLTTRDHFGGHNLMQLSRLAGQTDISVCNLESDCVGYLDEVRTTGAEMELIIHALKPADRQAAYTARVTDRPFTLHCSDELQSLLGLESTLLTLQDWLECIAVEDRQFAEVVFREASSKPGDCLGVTVIDRARRKLPVEIQAGSGGELQIVPVLNPGTSTTLLAQVYGLRPFDCDAQELLYVTGHRRFRNQLRKLQQVLKAEQLPVEIALGCQADTDTECMLCGEHPAGTVPELVLTGFRPSRAEMLSMLTSALSWSGVGAESSWYRFFHGSHQQGWHCSMALDRTGSLRIRMFAAVASHA